MKQEIYSLIVFIFISFVSLSSGKHYHFFRVVKTDRIPRYRFSVVLLSFLIFFLATSILFPVIFHTLIDVFNIIIPAREMPLALLESCTYSIAVCLTVFLIFTLLATKSKSNLHHLIKDFHFKGCSSIKWDVMIGIFGWLIALPIVNVVSQGTTLIVDALFRTVIFEQDAITYLKDSKDHPISLIFTTFTIALLAPLLEELVFRGLIQNYLSAKWGSIAGLLVSSAIFALVHFSFSQGLGNISIILSLFVLSLFIGHTYNRQRSLVAPLTFHAIFNSFTILQLLLT